MALNSSKKQGLPQMVFVREKQARRKAFEIIEKNIQNVPAYIQNNIDWAGLPVTRIGENQISQAFCDFFNNLDDKNKKIKHISANDMYKLSLTHQTNDKGHATNDAGIKAIRVTNGTPKNDSIILLRIEAKRLKTPGKAREKEYVQKGEQNVNGVYKSDGGIERFKMGVHSHQLPEAIMLAYIQTHNATHWHTQVNTWIDEQITKSSNTELTWAAQDKLQHKTTLGAVEKYHSKHERISDSSKNIDLHHYWLNLTQN
jgi:hypothetical protein